jgi:hypothetical protein
VQGELTGVMACNCSICSRKGSLLWFVPRGNLRLDTPEAAMATYLFNEHVIQHRFCPVCGMLPFGEAAGPDGNATAAINVRCLEGVELEGLAVTHFDGRSV